MSDVALANEPEARTATGEIKDQGVTPPTPTPTPETKTEQKPAEAKDTSLLNKEEKAPAGAPDKYEPFKVAEGHEMDEKEFNEVGALFKEMNLSQAQGQKLIDKYVSTNQEAFNAPFKAWEDLQTKWLDEVKADPEIGHRIPEIKSTIGKALDSLNDPKLSQAFRETMDLTGAGNNPAFIKAFWKLAQQVTEGKHVAGGGPSPLGQTAAPAGPISAARALYPKLP